MRDFFEFKRKIFISILDVSAHFETKIFFRNFWLGNFGYNLVLREIIFLLNVFLLRVYLLYKEGRKKGIGGRKFECGEIFWGEGEKKALFEGEGSREIIRYAPREKSLKVPLLTVFCPF